MNLDAYFARIGYAGPRAPDLATLSAVMAAHIHAVPFENLDVQLGRRLTPALPDLYAKIVERRRGGWCYEQNGLLGWALGEMGFAVRRISCGVLRAVLGDVQLGNHLALIVTIDGVEWLADVGFGGSLAGPIPLAVGEHAHPPYAIMLTVEADGYWRFTELAEPDKPFSFDFQPGIADEALLAAKCADLQTLETSPFVQNAVVQQRQGDRHWSLRGRVLAEWYPGGVDRRTLESVEEWVAVLRDRFGLDLPEAVTLWPAICARHAELFPDEPAPLTA